MIRTWSRRKGRHGTVATIALALAILPGSWALQDARGEGEEKEMQHARGEFDVQIEALELEGAAEGDLLGRFSLTKDYRGGLEAVGEGQMLTAGTAVEGSQAYVAMERVTGELDGRSGTFVLQHRGSMDRGRMELLITVVPDSATDDLEGLAGTFHLQIEGSKHRYDLEYTLPE